MSKGFNPYWLIFIGTCILFLPFLGSVNLFDWDEINFAESAREMLVSGNFRQVTVNFEPFWEKPPLFFWIQALCMKVFGVGEFAARLPNVFVAFATFIALFNIGKSLFNERFSWWWILLYAGSFTPHLYFHSGIIDPLFNLFIFLSIYQLFLTTKTTEIKPWLRSGLFLGLAVLTKGPVAGLIVLLCIGVYWVFNRFKFWFRFKDFLTFGIVSLVVTSLWFLPEIIINGPGFLQNFIAYQIDLFKNPVASHGQPWFYHIVVLLVGCIPASIVFIPSLIRKNSINQTHFIRWMKILFWVVLILFSLVTTKIIHYSSMCYLPITFLAALTFSERRSHPALLISVSLVALLWVIALVIIPIIGIYNTTFLAKYPDLIKGSFTKIIIGIDAGWSWYHFIPAVFLLLSFAWLITGWRINAHRQMRFALLALAFNFSVTLALFAPQIEQHTQNAAITFYQELQEDDCYVEVLGFKSYASYFYARVKPLDSLDGLFQERQRLLEKRGLTSTIDLNEDGRKDFRKDEMLWFLHGNIDKPVYIICQEKKIPMMKEINGFKMVMHKNGYASFRRWPNEFDPHDN